MATGMSSMAGNSKATPRPGSAPIATWWAQCDRWPDDFTQEKGLA